MLIPVGSCDSSYGYIHIYISIYLYIFPFGPDLIASLLHPACQRCAGVCLSVCMCWRGGRIHRKTSETKGRREVREGGLCRCFEGHPPTPTPAPSLSLSTDPALTRTQHQTRLHSSRRFDGKGGRRQHQGHITSDIKPQRPKKTKARPPRSCTHSPTWRASPLSFPPDTLAPLPPHTATQRLTRATIQRTPSPPPSHPPQAKKGVTSLASLTAYTTPHSALRRIAPHLGSPLEGSLTLLPPLPAWDAAAALPQLGNSNRGRTCLWPSLPLSFLVVSSLACLPLPLPPSCSSFPQCTFPSLQRQPHAHQHALNSSISPPATSTTSSSSLGFLLLPRYPSSSPWGAPPRVAPLLFFPYCLRRICARACVCVLGGVSSVSSVRASSPVCPALPLSFRFSPLHHSRSTSVACACALLHLGGARPSNERGSRTRQRAWGVLGGPSWHPRGQAPSVVLTLAAAQGAVKVIPRGAGAALVAAFRAACYTWTALTTTIPSAQPRRRRFQNQLLRQPRWWRVALP